VGANKGDLLNLAALGGIFGGEKTGRKYKILDTSVIIDVASPMSQRPAFSMASS